MRIWNSKITPDFSKLKNKIQCHRDGLNDRIHGALTNKIYHAGGHAAYRCAL